MEAPPDEYVPYRPKSRKAKQLAAVVDEPPPKKSKAETVRSNQTKGALYHLTPQELRFVKGVATGMNHTEAVKAAGFRGDGQRGVSRGWRLMQKPVVRAALYELMCDAFDKAGIETAQWLREVACIAFIPDALIDGKPRYQDKLKALDLLGNFQKILERSAPPAKSEVNIINLITQTIPKGAAAAPVDVVQVAPVVEPEPAR